MRVDPVKVEAVIEASKESLLSSAGGEKEPENPPLEPIADEIEIGDFAKVDLKRRSLKKRII